MGNILQRLERWADRELQSYKDQQPRELTAEDRASFFEEGTRKPPRTTEQARQRIADSNPVRWARLQREFRWAQKRAKKMGINPEDVRWLL